MLGFFYTLVDGRTECKVAGGAFGKPIKDVMGCQSGGDTRPAARFARSAALVPVVGTIHSRTGAR